MMQIFCRMTIKLTLLVLFTVGIITTVAAQKFQPDEDDLREMRLRRTETLLTERKAVGMADASRFAPAADGNLDLTFNANVQIENSIAYEISVQTDGKILIGGDFTNCNNFAQANLVRLNADGTADSTFQPIINSGAEPRRSARWENYYRRIFQPR